MKGTAVAFNNTMGNGFSHFGTLASDLVSWLETGFTVFGVFRFRPCKDDEYNNDRKDNRAIIALVVFVIIGIRKCQQRLSSQDPFSCRTLSCWSTTWIHCDADHNSQTARGNDLCSIVRDIDRNSAILQCSRVAILERAQSAKEGVSFCADVLGGRPYNSERTQ